MDRTISFLRPVPPFEFTQLVGGTARWVFGYRGETRGLLPVRCKAGKRYCTVLRLTAAASRGEKETA